MDCGKSKSNEKTQAKELGCAEREDHRRAEGPTAKTVFGDGDARPELASRWWPAHQRCVCVITLEPNKNSSCYRQLEAIHGNGVMLGACIPNRRSILQTFQPKL